MNVKNMFKLGVILAVFATAACIMLAFVYAGTSTIIAAQEEADLQAALKEIFPEADNFEPATGIKSPDTSVVVQGAYRAVQDGQPVGVALKLSKASYSDQIIIMVGVSVDGTITGVKIMEHSDTPGLGANAASPSYFVDRTRGITFYGQFAGKNVNDPFEVKGDVAAITAATVTSKAVASSVKAAGLTAAAWFAEGGR